MKYIFSTIILFSILSCKVIDPEEIVPSYIYINDIQVNTSVNEGTSSDKIVDAWVYVNGGNIGIYELPAKIPIHAEGNYTLEIFAGIKNTSLIPTVRMRYPFYQSFKESRNSVKNNIDTIIPIVEYRTTATIWVEDFEDPGIKFSAVTNSDTSMVITTASSEVLEGTGSGKIHLISPNLYFESKTNEVDFNSFKTNGSPIMMELNYKGNAELIIGIYHKNSTTTIPIKERYYRLKPSAEWNKTYLNLMTLITQFPNSKEFDFYFELKQNASSDAKVFIDNIKVLY